MDDEQSFELDPRNSPPPQISTDRGLPLALINGVLASIGGVYLMTRSVTVTVISGCVALFLAALIVAKS